MVIAVGAGVTRPNHFAHYRAEDEAQQTAEHSEISPE
jgi:hypothetical protein